MLRLVLVAAFVIIGGTIGTVLAHRADDHLLDSRRGISNALLDENNYTVEGKRLRRRALWFANGYSLAIVLYFVIGSHILSCNPQPPDAPPRFTTGR
jgi:pheromone shutdown protein TraB